MTTRYRLLAVVAVAAMFAGGLGFAASPVQAGAPGPDSLDTTVSSASAGLTFGYRTIADGLGSNDVFGVFAAGSTVYAATAGGLSISTNGGTSFTNRTSGTPPGGSGLGNNLVRGVFAAGSTVYAATDGGLGISTDGGTSFTNRTTVNGLGSNVVSGVFAAGSTVYAATTGGLSISTNGGASFVNRTAADGLGSNVLTGVFADGDTVYAATDGFVPDGGLSISTNGGASFVNRTTANGLGDNRVTEVFADGSTVYAATWGGLSISTDGGATFTNRTTVNGLGDNLVVGVFADGSAVYAATIAGLSISTDGGANFTNRTTVNGLGSNVVSGVFAAGSTVYAATTGGLSIAPTVPGAPTGVSGTPGNAQVTVSWTAPEDDGGNAITGYMVTASPGGQTCTTTGALSCVVSGLTNGTAYTFAVVATNEVGNSSASTATAPVAPATVPGAPTGVSGTPGNAQVTVSWTAPEDDGGNAITGYTVTASPGGATCGTAGALTCVVTGLTNGTSYTFTVVATNAVGDSPASEPSAQVTPRTVPGVPTGVSGVAGNGQVAVSWTAAAADGGSAITGYTVTSSPENRTCTTAGELTCVVTGLTNGTTYTFRVVATNAAGNSPASEASASIVAGAPATPTGVSGVAGNGQVAVSWTAAAADGGSAITGYTVTSSPENRTCATTGALTCVVAGLTNGTTYTFRVRAVNAVATSAQSAPSAPIVVRTVPGVPTGISAAPGNGRATVSWSAPTFIGGAAITGYTVTASPGGATCTTAGAPVCVVTGLTNGTPYRFTVVATNAAGNSVLSSPSAEMTPAPPAPAQCRAYVTNQVTNTVSVFNAATDTIVATAAIGGQMTGVAVSPVGTRVYVSHHSDSAVSVIDTTTNSVIGTIPVEGSPVGVAISQDGTSVYAISLISHSSGSVSVIDTDTKAVSATITLASRPSDVAVSPDGTRLYVSNFNNSAVSVIDTTTMNVLDPIEVPGFPVGVAVSPDGTRVYLTDNSGVWVVDTATNTVAATVTIGGGASGIAVSPDGGHVYVINNVGGASVSVIDTTIGAVTATINVGSGPSGVAVSPDGTRVYVTNEISRDVSVIDTATDTVTGTIALGAGNAPRGVAFGPCNPVPTPERPSAPRSLRVTPGNARATVSWNAPASNGGSAITGYTVTASPGSRTCTTAGLSCVVSGLDQRREYTFSVVANNAAGSSPRSVASVAVTPGAGDAAQAARQFRDVPRGAFYARAVDMLFQRGITTGAGSANRFAPDDVVTRAQMAAFLWRMAGEPSTRACSFRDQAQIPVWARTATCWLKNNGYTTNDPFDPNGTVTRAQMAAFLFRIWGPSNGQHRGSCGFNDQGQIPSWARSATCWLRDNNITTGFGNTGGYAPQVAVSRGQMAAFLYRIGGTIERRWQAVT